MDDLFKVALPAAIALVGTVAGLVLAYRQAKRRPQAEAASAYASERRAAFKALWEQLEDVHAYARSLEVDPVSFDARMREVNVRVLRTEPYLGSTDRSDVAAYLTALAELAAAARANDSPDARREIYVTGAFATPSPNTTGSLSAAVTRVERRREQLMPRFRAALEGK